MTSATLLEAMYGAGRPKPAVIQYMDEVIIPMPRVRVVHHYKGRRYVTYRDPWSAARDALLAYHSRVAWAASLPSGWFAAASQRYRKD